MLKDDWATLYNTIQYLKGTMKELRSSSLLTAIKYWVISGLISSEIMLRLHYEHHH